MSEAPLAELWLTIRTGEDRGKSVRMESDGLVMGREDGCDLVLDDPKISRRHACVVRLPDGRIELRDLGSSNGTFVNGARVQTSFLRGQEQVQLGNTVLVASEDEPSKGHGSTMLGSAVVSRILGSPSESALHRLLLQRSVRRATALGVAALVAAVVPAVLFVMGVLPPGRDESAVERVVRGVAPSTVLIEAQRDGVRVSSGTGWVLDARAGLIVTNAHVVNGGSAFRIGVADGFRPARIVGAAPCEDLAVLRVRDHSGMRSLPLGSQSGLELGEAVVAVGYPANASAEANLTSTTGVVSVVRTAFREPALDIPRYPNVVQTDAAINPGNSGGPLLDLRGRLIGVNSAGRTIAPDGRIVQGQNYAIGVDRVREITAVLRTGRSIGWTGLSFEYPTPQRIREEHLPVGLLTGPAVPGSGAAKAGLGQGAQIILAVDGVRLDNSLASYCDAVGDAPSGQAVTFTVLEPGTSRQRRVKMPIA